MKALIAATGIDGYWIVDATGLFSLVAHKVMPQRGLTETRNIDTRLHTIRPVDAIEVAWKYGAERCREVVRELKGGQE